MNHFLESLQSINKKSNKITKFVEPFFVCEIEDFLKPHIYYELARTFPSVGLFGQPDGGGKEAIDSRSKVTRDFILDTPVWFDFIESINNHKTSLVLKEYLEKYIPERKNFKNREWLTEEDFYFSDKKLKKSQKLDVNLVRYSFEFSHLKYGTYIPPHTDSMDKVVSMILYFPDLEIDWSRYECGTCFLKPKKNGMTYSTHESIHLKGEKLNSFRQNYEIFHYAEFVPNKFLLFLKNDVSWHEVKPQIHPDPLTRKAFIINMFCR